jgi:beta-N-acetylhexosaminidase
MRLPRRTRTLELILIAIIIMICVMTVLLVAVYLYQSNRGNIPEFFANPSETSPYLPLIDQENPSGNATNSPELQSTFIPIPLLTLTPTPELLLQPTPTVTPSQTPIAWVDEQLASMTLAQKVGQMILTGVSGTTVNGDTCQFLRRISAGGVVYLGSNVANPLPSQLNALSMGLQNCMANGGGIPLLISIDHEGQYVNRFPYDSQMTIFPPAMALGASSDPELAYQAAYASGLELAASGVNMVLGPVADVYTDYDNTVISQRSFGSDPNQVNRFVEASVRGYLEAGVIPVLKHFPGHGDVPGDSHAILPLDNADSQRLFSTHLVPFQGGINQGAPAVMMSHVAFPQIDSEGLPASMSAPIYNILRHDLGFQGIALSDSLGMGAVSSTGLGTSGASIKAVNAGIDMLLLASPNLAEEVYWQVLSAAQSGEIPLERIDGAAHHILTVKYEQGLAAFPLPASPSPDWIADQNLATDIGYQAVSLLRDNGNQIPIPENVRKILIVAPSDGWGLYPYLRTALDQKGIQYSILSYTGYWYGPIPETYFLQTVPARASENDLTIVFTWDAHPNRFVFGDTFQIDLVNTLLDGGYQPVVIALKSPTDILEFPGVKTYLASMGTTRGQIHAIVDILVGKADPIGTIPLQNLP